MSIVTCLFISQINRGLFLAFSAGEFLLYSGVRSRCRLGMHDVAVEGHDVVGEEDDGVGGGSSSRGAVILLTGSLRS